MVLISLKDYAKQNNITYEAVRQQVNRYADELGGHIIRDGRQQFLDEEAVAFLDGKRQKNPVVIIQQDKDEMIELLRREKEELLTKVAELSVWKADNAIAIAEANHRQSLLEAGEEKIKALEGQIAQVEQKASEDVQKAQNELVEAYDKFEVELDLVKKEYEKKLEDAEKRNQELENRTLGEYLKGLFRKKGKKHDTEKINNT